jgi:hypothetical protein
MKNPARFPGPGFGTLLKDIFLYTNPVATSRSHKLHRGQKLHHAWLYSASLMLDIGWLIQNFATAWRNSPGVEDFAKRILYLYSHRLPGLGNREWTIGFRYRQPLGALRLVLRSNAGSDGFIHSEVFEHEYYNLNLRKSPETIFDLEANIGLAALYFARIFPNERIACVEPISSNLRYGYSRLILRVMRKLFLRAIGLARFCGGDVQRVPSGIWRN